MNVSSIFSTIFSQQIEINYFQWQLYDNDEGEIYSLRVVYTEWTKMLSFP